MRSLAIRRNSLREKEQYPGIRHEIPGPVANIINLALLPRTLHGLIEGSSHTVVAYSGFPLEAVRQATTLGPTLPGLPPQGKNIPVLKTARSRSKVLARILQLIQRLAHSLFPLSQSSSTHPFRSGDNTGQSTGYVIRQFLRHSNFPRYFSFTNTPFKMVLKEPFRQIRNR